jgi:hypothetical protein
LLKFSGLPCGSVSLILLVFCGFTNWLDAGGCEGGPVTGVCE